MERCWQRRARPVLRSPYLTHPAGLSANYKSANNKSARSKSAGVGNYSAAWRTGGESTPSAFSIDWW